jgi:hypothetical protein
MREVVVERERPGNRGRVHVDEGGQVLGLQIPGLLAQL